MTTGYGQRRARARSRWSYVLKTLAVSIGLLILSSMLIFCLMRVIPGDPTITKVSGGSDARRRTPRALRAVRHELGLDRSLPDQYVHWVGGVVQGDFGKSYFSQFPVTTLISQRIGATLELASMALLLGLLIAVPAAMLGAIWRNRDFDGARVGVHRGRDGDAAFVTGIILIVVFGVKLKWLPTQGYVSIEHDPVESVKTAILPSITLAIAIAAPLLRILARRSRTSPRRRTSGLPRKGACCAGRSCSAPAAERDDAGADDGRSDRRLAARRHRDRRVRLRAARPRHADGRRGVQARLRRAADARPLRSGRVHHLEPSSSTCLYGVIDPRLRVGGGEGAR